MDSLHPSLSQALPLRDYDAEQVLQAPFRAAALGIATFYKKAAENGRKAYSLGYSSALQDVLEYLQAGLDYGTDQSNSQHSEQRMALTIERVMDYIQRRQEALRAEEPSDEDSGQPSSGPPQHIQSCASAGSVLSNSTLQQPSNPRIDSPAASSSRVHPVETPLAPSTEQRTPQATRRRVSPRRTPPVQFEVVPAPSDSTLSLTQPPAGSLTPPLAPPPSTLNVMAHPINLNFSSFVGPLPHHSHSSSTCANPARRHRGGTDGRKGKAKDRGAVFERERSVGAGVTSVAAPVVQFDPMGLFPTGYAHYTPSSTPSGGSTDRVLSSIGNKRRYPTEPPLIQDHPPSAPPAHRGLRRPSSKTLGTLEEVRSEPSEMGKNEDVLMVLEEEGEERPSKRLSRKH